MFDLSQSIAETAPVRTAPAKTAKVLVFSVALNGYQWRYRALLKSHQAYAERWGFRHIAVTQPSCSKLGMEVAWLKVALINTALRAGYDWVLFLDADTQVQPHAPNMLNAQQAGKDIYAARGFSGRFNSGVLMVRNSMHSAAFFHRLQTIACLPLPEEDRVGWGENGYFIHLAKQSEHREHIAELELAWNNNQLAYQADYIRHYSRGPLHESFVPSLLDRCLAACYHYGLALHKRAHKHTKRNNGPSAAARARNPLWQQQAFLRSLSQLNAEVCQRYPAFIRCQDHAEAHSQQALNNMNLGQVK